MDPETFQETPRVGDVVKVIGTVGRQRVVTGPTQRGTGRDVWLKLRPVESGEDGTTWWAMRTSCEVVEHRPAP
jgi:hypothetical protein